MPERTTVLLRCSLVPGDLTGVKLALRLVRNNERPSAGAEGHTTIVRDSDLVSEP